MIESIELNCGRTIGSEHLTLGEHSGVTIFVGPNNSGKSVLLNSLFGALTRSGSARPSALKSVRPAAFVDTMLIGRKEFEGKAPDDLVDVNGHKLTKTNWINLLTQDASWQSDFGQIFRFAECIWMNGTTRLAMLPNETNASLTNPNSALARLLSDDDRRKEFQETVFYGVSHYPFVDHVSLIGTLKLAFSTKFPEVSTERGMEKEMVAFAQQSVPRDSVSDGFNAYVGMMGTVFASDYKCIFIDEPEAFLHPALARTLGKQLAQKTQGKQIFVATHSADFVMGAIESGTPVRIVRLQFQNSAPTACLLDQDELAQFMNDPLLRSANVLSGLFAGSVVVGESDTDRAFYQEINTRLLTAKDPRGIENAVFLNAQNKQTVPKIVKLLRKMGVPTVGMVDLDVLAEGGRNWVHQMTGSGVPDLMRDPLATSRQSVFASLQAASTDPDRKDYKTRGGINLLDRDKKEAAESVLSKLLEYGLLVVARGEVEAWLSELDIGRSKHTWLREIFERLGNNPADASYVRPVAGDVWDFVGTANQWLKDPIRKGMNI
ncbi:MAG: ATP-dependent endonuclease [Microgenomates group bacterium]